MVENSSLSLPPSLFCAATITAAHGIRGQVKVKCFLEDPRSFKSYSPYLNEKGERAYKIVGATPHQKDILIVDLEETTTRNDAEPLKGVHLYLNRESLPDLSKDTYYHQDLIGLSVLSEKEEILGVIYALYNFGAGELLEIKKEDGSLHMIPFTMDIVPTIKVGKKKIVLSKEGQDLLEGGDHDD